MKTTNAILVTPEQTKELVVMTVSPHALQVLRSGEVVPFLSLSYRQLEFEWGGNGSRLLFINTGELRGAILYVEAKRDFLHELQQVPTIKEKIVPLMRDRKKNHWFSWAGVLLVMGMIASLIIYRAPLMGGLATAIPFSLEKKIAASVFNPKLTPLQKETLDQMQTFLSELQFSQPAWNQAFTFHISSEPVANAYATIGGHVFVNKGLVLLLDAPEELLGVIAHEMIHVQKRHVIRSLGQGLGLFALIQLFFGDFTGVAAVLIDQGGPLLNLQFSRTLEEEADDFALQLLAQNKINPSGLAQALEKMHIESQKMVRQSPGSEVLEKLQKIEILSSHPEIEKRIANLKIKSQALSQEIKFKEINFDYSHFQSDVKERF